MFVAEESDSLYSSPMPQWKWDCLWHSRKFLLTKSSAKAMRNVFATSIQLEQTVFIKHQMHEKFSKLCLLLWGPLEKPFYTLYTRGLCFIVVSKHSSPMKTKVFGLRPSAFISFLMFGNPDETLTIVYEILLEHHFFYPGVEIATVNSLLATTSRKRPPPIRDHFVNNRFVSQSNTVSKILSKVTTDRIS